MYYYLILVTLSILNSATFIKLDNQLPTSIDLNSYELSVNSNLNQKHYNKLQIHDGIPVFGRNIKIHYNIINMPSSMSSNYHYGEFEYSAPT